MDLVNIVSDYAMQFISTTPTVIGIATMISIWLPNKLNTEKDNTAVKAIDFILEVFNKVSGNILNNKNETK